MSDDTSGVQEPTAQNRAPAKESNLAVWSYVAYWVGNTPFAATILALYYPLWLSEQYGAGDALFNAATAVASLLVVLIAPALGAIADFRQSRIPYIVVLTLVVVFLTVALDFTDDLTGSLLVAVIFFVVAVVAYQLINVPYNALLPSVAVGRGTGRISGYAQAGGFIGTFVALLALKLLVAPQHFLGFTIGGPEHIRRAFGPVGFWIQTRAADLDSNTFLPTAAFFLLFALPAFFFVPDVAVHAPQPARLGRVYRSVLSTVRGIGAYTGLGIYMLVTLFYTVAANTAIPNMMLFGKHVLGMKDNDLTNLIIFSLIFSFLAALGSGYVADKVGPKRTLLVTLVVMIVAIMAIVLAWAPWVMFVAGPLILIVNAATAAVGPVMLIALSPREKLTEFMGFFTTVFNLSSVVGPAIIALLLLVFGGLGLVSHRIAVSSLAVATVLAIFLLLRVPDARTQDAPT
jgi:UMF1 family MFS transporter